MEMLPSTAGLPISFSASQGFATGSISARQSVLAADLCPPGFLPFVVLGWDGRVGAETVLPLSGTSPEATAHFTADGSIAAALEDLPLARLLAASCPARGRGRAGQCTLLARCSSFTYQACLPPAHSGSSRPTAAAAIYDLTRKSSVRIVRARVFLRPELVRVNTHRIPAFGRYATDNLRLPPLPLRPA
jgi:hypothetical protein